MPVGAHFRIHVEVIQQHELPRESMRVGSYLLSEQAQVGISISFADISEHLVVSAVLTNNVEDILDRGSISNLQRNRRFGRGGSRLQPDFVRIRRELVNRF